MRVAALLQLPLGALFLLSLLPLSARAEVNPDAPPLVLSYGRNGSIGPDGPWWFVPQAIDFPDQFVQMLPAISDLDLVIAAHACDDSTTCPLPIPVMWTESRAWEESVGNDTIGDDVDADGWDEELASLLGIEGRGRYFANRMTLYEDGSLDEAYYCDGAGLMLSDSYAVTYPGGQTYTMDTGFFSLDGGQKAVSWNAENGTNVEFNRTLPIAYQNGFIPSTSYGLHVGSVFPNVPGSLVLGGYDSSRALTEPIVSKTNTFTLNTIGLSSVGGYMYFGEPEPNDNQLTAPGLDVAVNPGAPYMYLPRDTCDKMAEFLPVKYNPDFNLYTWDESDSAFRDIMTSLHFMSFGFGSSNNRTQKINVPFALLNLTLQYPLVSEPTPYFPCSPLRDGQTATLGRAFLQAAFLASNWQSETTFLSQAPGPDFPPEFLTVIARDDTILAPATNPPDWASTWSSTLPPWVDAPESFGGGLSGGVIAGIVVGVIALLAILAAIAVWSARRRRRRQSWTKPQGELAELSVYAHKTEMPVNIYEVESRPPAQELDSNQQIGELSAEERLVHDSKW